VHAEGKIFGGFKEIDFAFEEEGVGTEVYVICCVPALLGCESFIENVIRILDFTATSAGKVATEKRLEHQDEGIAFVAAEFLSENIGGNRPSLANRNWHRRSSEATNTIAYVNGTRQKT